MAISFRRVPMRLATAVIATVYLLPPPSTRLLSLQALAADTTSFTRQVSPSSETNATEPSVAVDRSDGTEWVAWQASGTHVARSDDGGHTFVQTPISNLFGSDVGDVDIRVGGPTPCSVVTSSCSPGTHRVYVSSLEKLPLVLQTHVAYSDDRGASWTINNLAAVNPSFIDRPWLAVFASKASANLDQVYISYHDFSASQINVTASNDGGQTFGPSVDVLAQNGMAETQSFCNTVPSGIEVDPETGEVYVKWITADPVANTTQGCNITQIESFHQVWIAHSPPANASTLTVWDAHLVFDGNIGRTWQTNTDRIFATLAVDDSQLAGVPGNIYSVFTDNLVAPGVNDIWFTRSSDRGNSWARPVKVNHDKALTSSRGSRPERRAGSISSGSAPRTSALLMPLSRPGRRYSARPPTAPRPRPASVRQVPRTRSCTLAASAPTASFAVFQAAIATWRIRFPSQSIVAAALPWFGRIKAVSSMARHISPMDVSSQGNLLWRERNVTLAAKARPVLRPNNGEDQMRY